MIDIYTCTVYMTFQEVMTDIEKKIRTQILKQISKNSTLIYQYLLPLNLLFILLLIILFLYNYKDRSYNYVFK